MFSSYLKAGYPLLWAHSLEPHQSQESLYATIKKLKFKPYCWNIQQGIQSLSKNEKEEILDPVSMIHWLSNQPDSTVLIAHNLHLFLKSPEVIQGIQNGINLWKKQGKMLVILSPVVDIPVELERLMTVVEISLPNRSDIAEILNGVIEGNQLAQPENKDAVIDAAMGLTAFESENAFALSVIQEKGFHPEVISKQKAKLVEASSALEMSRFKETFDDLGGLENLKSFASRIARSELSRGILLVGVPGCGKSLFAKALGNELQYPTFSLDLGRIFGSRVGESEERIRRALQIVDAMSPAVLFIDELEKGIGGIASSNKTDGGTGSRVFGTFLTWLNDHASRVFVIATTNNISHLPPEFLRAERWDGVFFVDLPTPEEQTRILHIHKSTFKIDDQEVPNLTGWSGAEIRSLCRIAAMMQCSLTDAARYIVPLSKSMPEQIDQLRQWAKCRAIPAGQILGDRTVHEPKRRLMNADWQ
jgi:hypothetical protein